MSSLAGLIADLHEAHKGFEGFKKTLTTEMIDKAVALRGHATVRRRKLPPDTVVWLLVGMALYRNMSIREVASTIGLSVNGLPASSSLWAARSRLGAEPLEYLFKRLGETWSAENDDQRWKNLRLFGIDGTKLDIADSEKNENYFGRPGSKPETTASYPQARVVSRMNLLSYMMTDAKTTPLSVGENTAAYELITDTPSDSMTILDRGFQDYRNFCQLQSTAKNIHFLARVRSNLKYTFVKQLSGSAYLAKIYPSSPEDRNDESLPKELLVRIIEYRIDGFSQTIRVMTSLVDETVATSMEIAKLYHSRWEIELAFKDIKVTLLDRQETLRSQFPEGVKQEIAAIFLVYNLVRRETNLVARAHNVPTFRISFKSALHAVHKFFITTCFILSPGKLPVEIADLRASLWEFCLPPRRSNRSCPRWIKKVVSKFPRKPEKGAEVKPTA